MFTVRFEPPAVELKPARFAAVHTAGFVVRATPANVELKFVAAAPEYATCVNVAVTPWPTHCRPPASRADSPASVSITTMSAFAKVRFVWVCTAPVEPPSTVSNFAEMLYTPLGNATVATPFSTVYAFVTTENVTLKGASPASSAMAASAACVKLCSYTFCVFTKASRSFGVSFPGSTASVTLIWPATAIGFTGSPVAAAVMDEIATEDVDGRLPSKPTVAFWPTPTVTVCDWLPNVTPAGRPEIATVYSPARRPVKVYDPDAPVCAVAAPAPVSDTVTPAIPDPPAATDTVMEEVRMN